MLLRATALSLSLTFAAPCQGPPPNGPREVPPDWHALVGADVVVKPGQRITKATVVLRHGRIVSVTAGAEPPAGARVWRLDGCTIYPGLIETFLTVDATPPDPAAPGNHWSPVVTPQRSALDGPGTTADDRRELRGLGFTTAAIVPTGGIFKGSAAVVQLDEPATGSKAAVLRQRAFHLLSFQGGAGGYPSSQMGAIALLRQTLFDADWQQRTRAVQETAVPSDWAVALEALGERLPLAFETTNELELLRAKKIAAEVERSAFVFGCGMEFRRLEAIAATGLPIVVPLNLPEAPDVRSLAASEAVSLRELMSWEQAPTNSARLLKAGARLAWTTSRLNRRSEFREQVATAMANGVDADQALAMLTTVPAELLGIADRAGSVAAGMLANLVVVDGDLFDPRRPIRQVWVGGAPHEITAREDLGLDGTWHPERPIGTAIATVTITGDKIKFTFGEQSIDAGNVRRGPDWCDCTFTGKPLGDGTWSLHAVRGGDELRGDLRAPDGTITPWRAARSAPAVAAAAEPTTREVIEQGPLPVPFEAFGFVQQPPRQPLLLTGATLWTSDERGIVERGALLVDEQGKILYCGPAEGVPPLPDGTTVIDAIGKHVTPGMIDCHSHTGISRGVNEGGQAVSAEVRVGDVIDPDSINWYRQLAGGVTTVNQLHGSANAIGGQSSTVKVRWGCVHPDDMRFRDSAPGIKFALGENPRRANSSGEATRYPSTRMGVEALIRDRFVAAHEYALARQQYEAMPARNRAGVVPPRRDLELEALAEVLAGRRRVHCHSYRQDEIFMLCRMADEFAFKIGTFQHVLEGYKVAEAIRSSAVGASAFSDWWAYKLEVQDAIPHNGAIMAEAGVVVSFNSDSDELARRLNTEAAKAVKYGNVPPAKALQFVTSNPAIQLGIAERTGSLTRGKDADFVVWSGDPLSYLSRCESTYIDGRLLFSIERDRALRADVAAERARLIQKALKAKKVAGGEGRPRTDAFWLAEDRDSHYCCQQCEGDRK